MKNKYIHTQKNRTCDMRDVAGFSLIELMVSLTIFSVVMVISVGTLLTYIDANAKAQAMYSATTNLSFALDNITREIRTGYHYYCYNGASNNLPNINTSGRDCASDIAVAFVRERDNAEIGYRFDGNGRLEQKISPGPWIPLTADDVVVREFKIVVSGSEPYDVNGTDVEQPTVDLLIEGYVKNGLDTETDFNIQSHIVQRRLDIY